MLEIIVTLNWRDKWDYSKHSISFPVLVKHDHMCGKSVRIEYWSCITINALTPPPVSHHAAQVPGCRITCKTVCFRGFSYRSTGPSMPVPFPAHRTVHFLLSRLYCFLYRREPLALDSLLFLSLTPLTPRVITWPFFAFHCFFYCIAGLYWVIEGLTLLLLLPCLCVFLVYKK